MPVWCEIKFAARGQSIKAGAFKKGSLAEMVHRVQPFPLDRVPILTLAYGQRTFHPELRGSKILRSFEQLADLATEYRGNREALEALMPAVKTPAEIKAVGDDRVLSLMTRGVFQAGFSWKVIDNKWPGFEEAFEGFVPVRWKFMSDDDLDSLVSDKRIVRNGQKILSVRENAIFVCDLDDEYGSAATCFADWPQDELTGLLDMMKKRGSRLGGMTGQYFLRQLGRDSWALSRDVVAALVREGVIDKTPTSKSAMRAVQQAFNEWAAASGRPFAHISRMLALSVGPAI